MLAVSTKELKRFQSRCWHNKILRILKYLEKKKLKSKWHNIVLIIPDFEPLRLTPFYSDKLHSFQTVLKRENIFYIVFIIWYLWFKTLTLYAGNLSWHLVAAKLEYNISLYHSALLQIRKENYYGNWLWLQEIYVKSWRDI